MAYTALYRKWRPCTFDEVRGQDHIVRTLKNQIAAERVGHAYLFCGTRGTGKTSVAKIFARAVNCENPSDGSPCNECPTCKAIASGASVNVVEIDAASNNGVDNIREIREEVKYSPTEGKYRVYIIDEVHMLSPGAFNALLKTLEEPPAYVIFILATTEVHKIPITVLSRCQRYDFKRLDMTTLTAQIEDLLLAEKVEYEKQAAAYVARMADGSSRDALSLLEQCISFYYGEKLTYEHVLEVLGAVDQNVFLNLLQNINSRRVSQTLDAVNDLIMTGRDLGQFVLDFTWYMRNLLLVLTANPTEDTLGVSRDNLVTMKAEAENMDLEEIMRYIRILSELTNKIRFSSSKRVLLEVTLIKMMQPAMEQNLDSLEQRVLYLEEHGVRPEADEASAEKANGSEAAKLLPGEVFELPAAEFDTYENLKKEWPKFVEKQGKAFRGFLRGTKITYRPDKGFCILFFDSFYCQVMSSEEHLEDINQRLEKEYKMKFNIGVVLQDGTKQEAQIILGSRIPGIEMEINENQED